MLQVSSLVKVYPGPVAALQGVDLDVPARHVRPARAQRRRQVDVHAHPRGPARAHLGRASRLDGHDMLADPQWLRERLGYLPQEFGFYPHLTGRDMLLHLLRLKGVSAPGGLEAARRRTARAREPDRSRRSARSSRTRAACASGSASRRRSPAIRGCVIVDEPTAGLDPEERLRFYHLLAELAEDRIVLLSTHIVEDVAVLCPQFAVIRAGRLVARTTPRAAREALAGAIFEGVVPPAELPELREQRAGHAGAAGRGPAPRARLRARRRRAAGFEPVEPSLEDAYLVLMRTGALPGRARRARHVPTHAVGGARRERRAHRSRSFRQEFSHSLRRPLFWVQILLLGSS